MCKETPDIEKCQTTSFWRDVSVPVLSLSLSLFVSISVSRDLFVFVLFCFVRLFPKAVFDPNFGFSGSVFLWLWGLLWLLSAFVLRPFSTCSSLMSFSRFSRFLWFVSLLVASFYLSVLSRVSQGSFLSSVRDSFFYIFFFFIYI